MEKVRVLQVILSFNTGGAERSVLDLMENLDKSRFEVMAVSLFPPNGRPFEIEAQSKGIKIVYLSCKKRKLMSYLKTIHDLIKIIKQFKPHVVHSHLKVLPFLLVPYTILRIPVKVHTIHSVAYHDAAGLTRFVNWFCFRFLKVVPVSISKEVAKTVERLYGLKSPVIYNGIDTQRFVNLGPRRIKNSDEKVILINVARFEPQKNHKLLIEAIERALQEHPNMELWLIGDGSLRQEIELMVERKGLKEKVKFLGVRSDIPQLLHQADIFVLSSDYEGFGLVVAEAMAAGVPVIATAVGGVPEVLGEGEYGVLVPPKDVEALARAIVELARDEKRRAELSERGRKFVVEKFDIRNTVKEYEKLYLSLLEKKKR